MSSAKCQAPCWTISAVFALSLFLIVQFFVAIEDDLSPYDAIRSEPFWQNWIMRIMVLIIGAILLTCSCVAAVAYCLNLLTTGTTPSFHSKQTIPCRHIHVRHLNPRPIGDNSNSQLLGGNAIDRTLCTLHEEPCRRPLVKDKLKNNDNTSRMDEAHFVVCNNRESVVWVPISDHSYDCHEQSHQTKSYCQC